MQSSRKIKHQNQDKSQQTYINPVMIEMMILADEDLKINVTDTFTLF